MNNHATVSFIIPSAGRDSVKKTIESIETWEGDEVLVIQHNPPSGNWGSAERNEGMEKAKCDYITFIDDDDIYVSGARTIMDNAAKQNPKKYPILFRMQYPSGRILWREPTLRNGNVGTPMIFIPNRKEMIQPWDGTVFADFQFINCWWWHRRRIIWRPEIIVLLGHESRNSIKKQLRNYAGK